MDDDELKPDLWRLAPGDTLSGHREVVDERGREVCIVMAMEPGDEEATRRGRLLAAAPELYEACKRINEMLCSMAAEGRGLLTLDEFCEIQSRTSDAYRKAEGKR